MGSLNDQVIQCEKRTPLFQKLACGMGHIFNDVVRQMVFSFTLIFYVKVAGLLGNEAGLVLLAGQLASGLSGPLMGHCSDKIKVPLLSRCLGDRKAWHLIGVLLVAVCLPFRFSPCHFCPEDSSWSNVVYYIIWAILGNIGFAAADIGHLSIVRSVAKNEDEVVFLNVLSTSLQYVSGIFVLGVVWIVLRRVAGDELSEAASNDFTIIACILVGVGLLFSGLIFHVFTKEQSKRTHKQIVRYSVKPGLLSIALVFSVGANYEEEKEKDIVGQILQERKASVSSRKSSSAMRKISAYIVPFDVPLSESHDMRDIEGQILQERKASVSSRKSSSAMRKISAYMVPFDVSLSESHDMRVAARKQSNISRQPQWGRSNSKSADDSDDEDKCFHSNYEIKDQVNPRSIGVEKGDSVSRKISNSSRKSQERRKNSADIEGQILQERNKASVSSQESSSAMRKISAYIVPFDVSLSESQDMRVVARKQSNISRQPQWGRSNSKSADDSDDGDKCFHSNYEIKDQVNPRSIGAEKGDSVSRKISNSRKSQERRKNSADCRYHVETFHMPDNGSGMSQSEEEGKDNFDFEDKSCRKKVSYADGGDESSDQNSRMKRKSSFPSKIASACHIKEVKQNTSKTRIDWLKSTGLYKVGVLHTMTLLVQEIANSYLPLYLMDSLEFEKEAIAYFPLVLLTSGITGTAISKILSSKLGKEWAYCVAAVAVIGSAVWFYLLEQPREMAYGPTLVAGIGSSAMFVMSLNFIMVLIGDNKETSGFVFSTLNLMAKVLSGAYFAVVQNFYPLNSGADNECLACGSFARLVLSLGLGVGSLLILLIVALDKIRTWCACSKDEGDSTEPSASDPSKNLPADSWDTRL